MSEEHYLRLGIDARPATTGAAEYARAAQSITGSSAAAAASVRGVSSAVLESFTVMQRQINSQFQVAGQGFTSQVKKQIEGRSALEGEYYKHTHSQREIELRNVTEYYDTWREKFKDHQEMMTLIDKTEAAAREKVEKEFAESQVKRFVLTQSLMRASVGVFAVSAVGSIANAAAEAHKAARKDEPAVTALLENLPIVGRLLGNVVHGFEALYKEISGVNEQLERTERLSSLADKVGGTLSEMQRRRDSLDAQTDLQRQLLDIEYRHQEALDKINAADAESLKLNENKLRQIRELTELMSKAPEKSSTASYGGGAMGYGMYGTTGTMQIKSKADYQKEIDEIRKTLEGSNVDSLRASEMKLYAEEVEQANQKAAQSYIETHNPIVALLREEHQIVKLQVKGYLDKGTATKALTAAELRYQDALMTTAQRGVRDRLRSLDIELSLIGKTNKERERAIDLMEFEKDARRAYGPDEAERYVRNYEEKLDRLERARDLEDIADSVSSAFTNTFKTLIEGTEDVSDAFRAMGREIVASVMQKTIFDPLSTALSAGISAMLMSSGGGGLAGNQEAISGAGGLSSNANTLSNFMANAFGNVFHRGQVMAFANGGIFDRPTLFPMRNGMGLMGEAGPEAVMPLKRGSDGRLGVSGGSQPLNVTVKNFIDSDTMADAMNTRAGERVIVNAIKKNRGAIAGMLG